MSSNANVSGMPCFTAGFTALHYAVNKQQIENIDRLLKNGASIDARNRQGKTPLDLAFEKYMNPQNELSLKSAVLIRLLDSILLDGETISPFLFLAVLHNDENLLRYLLRKNPAILIHFINEKKQTLLHVAAKLGHIKMVNLLILYGADIHAKTLAGEMPLHLASAAGHVRVIQRLLERGAQLESPDNNGNTPLYHAIKNNRRDVILLFNRMSNSVVADISLGINKNLSLLHFAVIRNDEEFFNLALKSGDADLSPRTKDGETPLHFGIVYNRLKLIYELVKRGAYVDAASSNGETPLHLAAALGQSHTVEFLLKKGADINCVTTSGSTPLHYVLDRERCNDIVGGYNRPLSLLDKPKTRLAVIKTLLKKQASVNVRDHCGKTPLHYAMLMHVISEDNIKYRLDTIRCLVNHGAELNATCNNNFTPIFYGFGTLDEKMLWWLICKGTDVKRKPRNSDSLLSKAIKLKNSKMVEILLEAGVDVNSQNLFEAPFFSENDKSNKFEILEMLANQTFDVKAINLKIGRLLSTESQITESDKEDIRNRLTTILVRRETVGELIIAEEDFESDDGSRVIPRNRFTECENQVFRMRNVRLDNQGLTLYNVFMLTINELANHATNQEMINILQSESIAEDFPRCANLLQTRVKKACARRLLLDFGTKSLFSLVRKAHKIKLPWSTSYKIVKYLNVVDLTHLMHFKIIQKQ